MLYKSFRNVYLTKKKKLNITIDILLYQSMYFFKKMLVFNTFYNKYRKNTLVQGTYKL